MAIQDVYPSDLIEKLAEELKKIEVIKAPEWAQFSKTGAHKARTPVEKDWWYKRTAAVLRSISLLGPIGVSKLRTKYGGKKRRGHKPAQFRKGSGSIIRKVLQQLDKAELTKYQDKGVHKGRILAPKGMSLLDKISVQISKTKPKPKVKVEVKKEKPSVEKKEEGKPVEAVEKKAEVKKEAKEEPKVPTAEKLIEETKKAFKDGKKVKEPVKEPTAEKIVKELEQGK